MRWDDIHTPTACEALEAWSKTTLLERLQADCREALSGAPDFVEPTFEREHVALSEDGVTIGPELEVFDLAAIVGRDANFMISAGPETGKSTVLAHMALMLAGASSQEGAGLIPIVIRFAAFRSYPASIVNLVRMSLETLPEAVDAETLFKSGLLAVLVDDVDLADEARLVALTRFVETYYACRFILISTTPFETGAGRHPELSKLVYFAHIAMRGEFHARRAASASAH